MNQLNVNLPELPYAVSEAMNRLRINIKFCGKNTRKILLTSCQPNEGKSTISSYLWKMLAEAGFPTVLVDVDLRKSVMKTRFQMDYDDDTTMGLNHYLSGMAEYEDVVYSTNIPNGYMVPCTQLLENPSALLEDVRFKELLNTLSENYRFVIIDSPPLGSVSDGALIASLCAGTGELCQSHQRNIQLLGDALEVAGDFADLVLPVFDMSVRAHQLQVVHHDEIKPVFHLEAAASGAQL